LQFDVKLVPQESGTQGHSVVEKSTFIVPR